MTATTYCLDVGQVNCRSFASCGACSVHPVGISNWLEEMLEVSIDRVSFVMVTTRCICVSGDGVALAGVGAGGGARVAALAVALAALSAV
jgi:hypothetical protein